MKFRERRPAVSSVVGSIFFVLIIVVAIGALVTIFNSFSAYNNTQRKAINSQVQVANTELSVSGDSFGAFPPSSTSNFNVATSCLTTSTSSTNQVHLFFASGMWWDFFTCNSNFQYSTSFDGVTWEAATTIPNLVAGYTVGPYFDIRVVGTTIYLVIADKGTTQFQLGIGTIASGGTYSAPAGTLTWSSAPAAVTTTANALGPINVEVDSAGNQWVAVVQGATAIAIYERQACASGTAANAGWEPNACSSTSNPTNYAPTSNPNLGSLSANANMIWLAPPSVLSSTGAILIYETGSATVPSTGTIGVITQTALAVTTWNQITLSGITDYSLTASSGLFVAGTFYFAGLQNAATGRTTGNLKFWTLAFTSMVAATNSAEQTIESGTAAWQAALTSSGTTLALFDNPSSSTIQYYTSSTLGSIWNSPAITLESGETAINGLSPASGSFAVTWANAAPNVRFAALSTFTVTNGSSFGVHVVDLYVYNPGTNSLVAHYYINSTEDFDYWIGQGSTATIPVRFTWAATTSYLVTVGTDTGVTAQLTANSPPVSAVACPAGGYFSQLSPTTVCGTPGLSTTPYLISGSGAETCTDTTSGSAVMTGFGLAYTTSASSSGNIYLSYSFQVTSPATSGVASTWQLSYATGTAPACGAAAAGTTLGQAYTVDSQAGVVRGLSQSVGVTLSGLSPSTTYWFDVQATDSSGAAWVYSNPDMGIVDVLSTDSPLLTTSTNTNTCTDTTNGAVRMMGFGTTFTTGGAGFTGNVFGKLSFNIAGAATSGINTKYTVAYGTGAAPACNAATAGTTAGNQYTAASQAKVASGEGVKSGFVLTGLSPSTAYWVDVQAVDSSNAAWVYSNPTLAVMEMPTPTNSLPDVDSSSNTNTCTVNTANTYKMAGFGVGYNIPSSAKGDLYITLTFEVSIPATSGINTQWQAAYQSGAAPACNTLGTGSTIGNTYTVTSQANVAGAIPQSETFVLQDVEKVAGTTIWVDIQAYDSTSAAWVFSNPEISVAALPG